MLFDLPCTVVYPQMFCCFSCLFCGQLPTSLATARVVLLTPWAPFNQSCNSHRGCPHSLSPRLSLDGTAYGGRDAILPSGGLLKGQHGPACSSVYIPRHACTPPHPRSCNSGSASASTSNPENNPKKTPKPKPITSILGYLHSSLGDCCHILRLVNFGRWYGVYTTTTTTV